MFDDKTSASPPAVLNDQSADGPPSTPPVQPQPAPPVVEPSADSSRAQPASSPPPIDAGAQTGPPPMTTGGDSPQYPAQPAASGFDNLATPSSVPADRASSLTPDQIDNIFKRETLSGGQKSIMFLIVITVIGGFIGGGIWLYISLDPFSAGTTSNTNFTVNSNGIVEDGDTTNTNGIPLYELDTDGDGLRDIDERKYGTDETVSDTDGDGYNDKSEIDNGYDPTDPNG